MQAFAKFLTLFDQSNDLTFKIKTLKKFLLVIDEKEKRSVIDIFTKKRPKKLFTNDSLKLLTIKSIDHPAWLFNNALNFSGDLAETIALIWPKARHIKDRSLHFWISFIQESLQKEDKVKFDAIKQAWDQMNADERFVFNKLITGNFRFKMDPNVLSKAIALGYHIDENIIKQRLQENWDIETSFDDFFLRSKPIDKIAKPYPFKSITNFKTIDYNASLNDWIIEQQWDGIRVQVIVRNGHFFIWNRANELITEKFPELATSFNELGINIVLDGMIVATKENRPVSYNYLESRLKRKKATPKVIANQAISFIAFDLLESEEEDFRNQTLTVRRRELENIFLSIDSQVITITNILNFDSWDAIELARKNDKKSFPKGFLLKQKTSLYAEDINQEDWLKWKAEPFTIEAVLLYATRGQGRYSKEYVEFTFAVWDEDQLRPFTKATNDLKPMEKEEINLFIKKNTLERFGPVRSLKAALVFELSFTGIISSKRHKSGIVLNQTKIIDWRKETPIEEAGRLIDLENLILTS